MHSLGGDGGKRERGGGATIADILVGGGSERECVVCVCVANVTC